MDKNLDLILRITAWSLLLIGIILLLLMITGILQSPEIELVSLFISSGLLIEIGRLETKTSNIDELKNRFSSLEAKFDMMWDDFRKRKRI